MLGKSSEVCLILSLMLSSGKDVGPDRINVSSLSRSVGKSSIGPRYSLKQAENLSLDARLCMRFVYRLLSPPYRNSECWLWFYGPFTGTTFFPAVKNGILKRITDVIVGIVPSGDRLLVYVMVVKHESNVSTKQIRKAIANWIHTVVLSA